MGHLFGHVVTETGAHFLERALGLGLRLGLGLGSGLGLGLARARFLEVRPRRDMLLPIGVPERLVSRLASAPRDRRGAPGGTAKLRHEPVSSLNPRRRSVGDLQRESWGPALEG